MSVDALPIIAESRLYSVEPCTDGSGVRFVWVNSDDGRRKWSAAIIDCGDEFAIAMASEYGIRMRKFKPTAILRFKNGENAPVDIDKQIEIETPYRTMVVRYLYSDESPIAVVIGYTNKGEKVVHSVALCQANYGSLMFSIAN